MRWTVTALILTGLLILQGCKIGLPRVHKITVQQGNVITQEMIDRLKPGMSRSQVLFVMGEPVLRNTFNNDRWDYLYTIELPGVLDKQSRLTLFFDNDQLAYFTGDYAPTSAITEDDTDPEHIIDDPEPVPTAEEYQAQPDDATEPVGAEEGAEAEVETAAVNAG